MVHADRARHPEPAYPPREPNLHAKGVGPTSGEPTTDRGRARRTRARGDGAAFAALVRDQRGDRLPYRLPDHPQRSRCRGCRPDGPRRRPGARSRASGAARRCGPGCSRSSRTRRATGGAAEGRREGSRCARAHELPSGGAAPSPEGRVHRGRGARRAARRARAAAARTIALVLSCRYLLELSEEETAEVLSSGAEPSSRAHPARSNGCARSWERPGDRARAPPRRAPRRDRLPADARPRRGLRARAGRSRALRLRPLAVALAVVLVVRAGVLAFSPGARSAFLENFRIRGATVARVEQAARGRASSGSTLGERVSRAEAKRLAASSSSTWASPTAIYRARGRTRLARLRVGRGAAPHPHRRYAAASRAGSSRRSRATGNRVEEVEVDGEPGLFVSGDEHFVMFRTRTAQIDDRGHA